MKIIRNKTLVCEYALTDDLYVGRDIAGQKVAYNMAQWEEVLSTEFFTNLTNFYND
jgi:hypothetical protein